MKINRTCSLLFALLIMLSAVFTAPAWAQGKLDTGKDLALTLVISDEGKGLSDVSFDIFFAASADERGELIPTEAFKDYPVSMMIRGENDKAWKSLASTLEGYVLRDKPAAFAHGTTGKDGTLCIPAAGETMAPGLYLVLGSEFVANGYIYTPQPFVVMLPAMDNGSNDWIYSIEASVKYTRNKKPLPPITPPRPGISIPQYTSLKVLKIWNDEGLEESRPGSITVQLLKDGEVWDTKNLTASMNWRYTWENLSTDFSWRVVEDGAEGYTVSIEKIDSTVAITNTPVVPPEDPPVNTPGEPPVTPPEEPSVTPPGEDPKVPSEEELLGDGDIPGGAMVLPDPVPGNVLPQTGQLWWPVPLLLCAGMLLLCSGLALKKRNH